MRYFKATIAYDGAYFLGYAKQPNKLGVQDKIESALNSLGIKSAVVSAGRTDKGVHANNQVLSFSTPKHWNTTNLFYYLAPKLAPHIILKKLEEKNFHARFDAKKRAYRYLLTKNLKTPFLSPYIACENYGPLDLLNTALKQFIGKHNFSLFKKEGGARTNPERTIFKAFAYETCIMGHKCVAFKIIGDAFLRSSVRLIVQASVAYSLQKITLIELQNQINNIKATIHTPIMANGLYLHRVYY
ncbi:tRNA pseudouridine(38-40) synthase TruA [Helicobacter cetorum]|uniref:tRNA pseudouridine(38-40) synthase TruA n=1 Tax=Helicobacter cetorum TaxID=138563 RepID=UPI000CF19A6E|nr:tRNA pseudouridine(38-40) synthase TruA [Helicobacter cetorum]